MSLWFIFIFFRCSLPVCDVRVYVCAVQISNVCIHYNIILCVFFRLFFVLHLCFVHDAVDFGVVYFFFLHRWIVVFVVVAAVVCICVHFNRPQRRIQMLFNKHSYKCIIWMCFFFSLLSKRSLFMSSKTHSKRWRISDVNDFMNWAVATAANVISLIRFFIKRPFYIYMHFFCLVRLPMSLNTRNSFVLSLSFGSHVCMNTKNS